LRPFVREHVQSDVDILCQVWQWFHVMIYNLLLYAGVKPACKSGVDIHLWKKWRTWFDHRWWYPPLPQLQKNLMKDSRICVVLRFKVGLFKQLCGFAPGCVCPIISTMAHLTIHTEWLMRNQRLKVNGWRICSWPSAIGYSVFDGCDLLHVCQFLLLFSVKFFSLMISNKHYKLSYCFWLLVLIFELILKKKFIVNVRLRCISLLMQMSFYSCNANIMI